MCVVAGMLVLGLFSTEAVAAVASVGYVNVSGTATNGGQTITIELKNQAGAVVGSGSYTTQAGDKEQHISDELKDDFNPTPGFTASKCKDKADGSEVIKFRRKKNGGQNFEIEITVNPGPSEITINAKGTYSTTSSCNVVPSSYDINAGTAVVDVVGNGTHWQTGESPVTSLFFADDIVVDQMTIVHDALITAEISWLPGSALPGGEHVEVIGEDFDDDGFPLTGIVHDVSTDPFVLVAPIPTVSQWGMMIVLLLVLTVATIAIDRRRTAAA